MKRVHLCYCIFVVCIVVIHLCRNAHERNARFQKMSVWSLIAFLITNNEMLFVTCNTPARIIISQTNKQTNKQTNMYSFLYLQQNVEGKPRMNQYLKCGKSIMLFKYIMYVCMYVCIAYSCILVHIWQDGDVFFAYAKLFLKLYIWHFAYAIAFVVAVVVAVVNA